MCWDRLIESEEATKKPQVRAVPIVAQPLQPPDEACLKEAAVVALPA